MNSMKLTIDVSRSFEESDQQDLVAYAAMKPIERLALVEKLRQSFFGYSYDKPARLQYVLSVTRPT